MPKLLIALALALVSTAFAESCTSDKDILKQLFQSYDRDVPPQSDPVQASGMAYIGYIPKVCPKSQSATILTWIIQEWTDQRLDFSSMTPCSENITLAHHTKYLWTPELQVINAYEFEEMRAPASSLFGMLVEDGTVFIAYQAKITMPCDFVTTDAGEVFRCEMIYESFRYNTGKLDLTWNDTWVDERITKHTPRRHWQFKDHSVDYKTVLYPAGHFKEYTIAFDFKFTKADDEDSKEEKEF